MGPRIFQIASTIEAICNIASSVNIVLSRNMQICDHLRSKGHVKNKEITVLHILSNGKISVKVYKQISNRSVREKIKLIS